METFTAVTEYTTALNQLRVFGSEESGMLISSDKLPAAQEDTTAESGPLKPQRLDLP